MEMSVELRAPLVSRPLAYATEEKVVHSWSRISSAGHNVLLDALHILSPKSRELSSTDDLVSFLQELRDEGHRPTVLRSKDVYRYRSCMTLPLTEDMLRQANRNIRPTAKKKRRRVFRKREVHPSWSVTQQSSPRIQGVPPPELRTYERPVFVCSRTSRWAQDHLTQSCLRLTNIEGQSGFHTARLQVQPTFSPTSSEKPAASLPPASLPPLSGLPPPPLQNAVVALFSQKTQSCPVRSDGALIGDSAPVFDSPTHAELHSPQWTRSNGVHRDHRRRPKETRSGWKDKRNLMAKVVKVDDSRSVAEARLKAQKILQVNLSPVIQIQPIHHILRDFRYQIK